MIPQIGAEVATSRQGRGGAFEPTGTASSSASSCDMTSSFVDLIWLSRFGAQIYISVWRYCGLVMKDRMAPLLWYWGAMLESHRLGRTMPLSITWSRFPSYRNICPNHRGVYQKVPSLKLLFEQLARVAKTKIKQWNILPCCPKWVIMSPQRGKERTIPIMPKK